MNNSKYVLITAARNEESFIENTLKAVISQTISPTRWVIVSDGSTDRTDDIIRSYSKDLKFIRLLRLEDAAKRNFRSQVYAINAGVGELRNEVYQYIGNTDADISFGPEYFHELIKKFQKSPKLGLAGGTIYEENKGVFAPRKFNSVKSVPHAVQFFRRECFEQVGGYLPLKYGGPDTHAVVMARMIGWKVQSYPDLYVFHHRPTSSCEGFIRAAIRQGKMDYSLGNHPLFELFKCASRIREKPYFLYAFTHMIGFVSALCQKESRIVSDEFINYLRKEQLSRIKYILKQETLD